VVRLIFAAFLAQRGRAAFFALVRGRRRHVAGTVRRSHHAATARTVFRLVSIACFTFL